MRKFDANVAKDSTFPATARPANLACSGEAWALANFVWRCRPLRGFEGQGRRRRWTAASPSCSRSSRDLSYCVPGAWLPWPTHSLLGSLISRHVRRKVCSQGLCSPCTASSSLFFLSSLPLLLFPTRHLLAWPWAISNPLSTKPQKKVIHPHLWAHFRLANRAGKGRDRSSNETHAIANNSDLRSIRNSSMSRNNNTFTRCNRLPLRMGSRRSI